MSVEGKDDVANRDIWEGGTTTEGRVERRAGDGKVKGPLGKCVADDSQTQGLGTGYCLFQFVSRERNRL